VSHLRLTKNLTAKLMVRILKYFEKCKAINR
jgi:hypothetical protein